MAGPNVSGMVNDPDFIKLSPADQRQALYKLTGDQSFPGLSDGDTLQFVSKMRTPSPQATPTGTISNAPTGPLAWLKNLGGRADDPPPAIAPQQEGVGSSILSEIGSMVKGIPNAVRGMFDPATIAQRGAALYQSDVNRQQDNRSVPYRAVAGVGQAIGINAPKMEEQADQGNARGVIGTAIGDALPVLAGSAAREAIGRLPSKAGAGALLEQAKSVAGPNPVNVETPGQIALRMQQLQQSGASMPRVVQKFLSRVTEPDAKPLTYSEARDFYINTTALSANENLRISPVMKFQLEQFKRALAQSIQETANQSGVGDVHAAGMSQYAKASALSDLKANAIKYGVKPAIGTAAAAAGAKAGYDLYENLKR